MELTVTSREIVGKKTKGLRRGGLIPAELYGHGVENVHLSVPSKEFGKVFREAGTNTVVSLSLGKEKRPVIIHKVMFDYITGEVMSIDFYQVNVREKIKAKVPLEFVGDAPAVKEKNATVTKAVLEIEVEALPNDLPHRLTVDLSALTDIGKTVYVSDLKIPHGVKVLAEETTAIVTATPQAAEEKVEVPMDVSEVKVESEEKAAERQAEKVQNTAKEDTK